MPVKTFTTGEVLTASDTNSFLTNGGLVYITQQTIGTAVASVTVSNCFSATYDNYRIVISGGMASIASDYGLQLSGITTSVYQTFGFFMTPGTATLNAYGPAATTQWLIGSQNTVRYAAAFDVIGPNLAQQKFFGNCMGVSTTGYYNFAGSCTSTSSATGFTINVSTGTWTGGTIRVYGYRQA